jgi:cell division protein FtsQ
MNALVRLFAWLLALGVVALPVVAVLNGWFAADRWPLTQLRVAAEFERVSAEQIRAAVQPHLGAGFFAIDLDAAHAALSSLPWVDRVELRKQWPDTLEVVLTEHAALARFGESRLLSSQGALFEVPALESLVALPRFEGPDTQVHALMQMHADSQGLLAPAGLRVERLQLSPRGSWTLVLSGGTELVLGRAEPLPRLQRFAAVLPELLRAEARPLLRADLRYANGFALRWADPPAPEVPGQNT